MLVPIFFQPQQQKKHNFRSQNRILKSQGHFRLAVFKGLNRGWFYKKYVTSHMRVSKIWISQSVVIFLWALLYSTNFAFTTKDGCHIIFLKNFSAVFLIATQNTLRFRPLYTANRKWPWLIKIRFRNLRVRRQKIVSSSFGLVVFFGLKILISLSETAVNLVIQEIFCIQL